MHVFLVLYCTKSLCDMDLSHLVTFSFYKIGECDNLKIKSPIHLQEYTPDLPSSESFIPMIRPKECKESLATPNLNDDSTAKTPHRIRCIHGMFTDLEVTPPDVHTLPWSFLFQFRHLQSDEQRKSDPNGRLLLLNCIFCSDIKDTFGYFDIYKNMNQEVLKSSLSGPAGEQWRFYDRLWRARARTPGKIPQLVHCTVAQPWAVIALLVLAFICEHTHPEALLCCLSA